MLLQGDASQSRKANMPFIDAQPHRVIEEVFVAALCWQAEEVNRVAPSDFYFLNVYYASELLTFAHKGFHICKLIDNSYEIYGFHNVPRKMVFKKAGQFRDVQDNCVTVVWHEKSPTVDFVQGLLVRLSELFQSISHLKGEACILPINPHQLPFPFEIGAFIQAEGGTRQHKVFGFGSSEDRSLMAFSNDDVERLGAVLGIFADPETIYDSPVKRSVHLSARWQRKAIEAKGLADWEGLVIYSNTWIETLIVQLATICAEAKGEKIRDIQGALRPGLHRFATTHLGAKYLGGKWDHTLQKTAFGEWYSNCFIVRHEVVHKGRLLDADVAASAYNAAHRLAFYITDLVGNVTDPILPDELEPLIKMSHHFRARSRK